ncbi:ATP-binding protein [Streptomyces thermolineatus]|uniref:ATP-binding protein n=1 Tax=Streptomyces thermolineatus TaxID=44033 RepID=UPI003850ABAE
MSAHIPTRQQVRRPSEGRALLVLLVTGVVTAGACLWLTAAAPTGSRTFVAWSTGVAAALVSIAAAVAARGAQAAEQLRHRIRTAEAEADRRAADAARHYREQMAAMDAEANRRASETARHYREQMAAVEAEASRRIEETQAEAARRIEESARLAEETNRLAEETLPALVKQLRDGASADTALARTARPALSAHRRILQILAREVGRSERMRASAMSACANAAGRVQALATSMLADLREMQGRHGEEVLGDLLKLDHSTAQAGRLADSIAVLTGARSGRRWTKPIVMESVLRGAVGRISSYQRVRLHSTSTAAVAGYAAEGVMHALAELMDNATSFSPPTEEVQVYVEEVHAGVVVTIEDGGLVMSPAALRRAEEAVSARELDLTTLSGTRLGLAVVGCLARKHGLTVSFRPSSRGGTGVVVMIPRQLITETRQDSMHSAPRPVSPSSRPAAPAPLPEAPAAPAAPTGYEAPAAPAAPAAPTGHTAPAAPAGPAAAPGAEVYGLPKRRRGETLAQASRQAPAADPEEKPARPRPDASRLGAFHQAGRHRAAATGTGSDTAGDGGTGSGTGTNPFEDGTS